MIELFGDDANINLRFLSSGASADTWQFSRETMAIQLLKVKRIKFIQNSSKKQSQVSPGYNTIGAELDDSKVLIPEHQL